MQNLQEVSQNPQIPPPVSENRGQAALFEIVEKLPPNSYLTFYEKTWEDYENGNSIKLDFSVDPPHDIAVEIDIPSRIAL